MKNNNLEMDINSRKCKKIYLRGEISNILERLENFDVLRLHILEYEMKQVEDPYNGCYLLELR